MKKSTILVTFLFIIFASSLEAADYREIILNDGSIIYGEIISFDGNIYTVNSETLGKLRINSSKINVIRMKGSPASPDNREVQSLQNKIMGNPNIIDMIRSLQNDPEIRAVLEDPDLMEAINSGNIDALISNPKFLKMLENLKIKDIGEKVLK